MTATERKIKNWKVPQRLLQAQFPVHNTISTRALNCLQSMKIRTFEDVIIPSVWYASTESWTTIMLNQPNLGRKAYRDIVEYLVKQGLEPIYDDDHESSGEFMR